MHSNRESDATLEVTPRPVASNERNRRGDPVIQPLAWVWFGIVIGVSFLATPIKFTADSLTRPVALDVGRATFHALAYLEWALTAVLVVAIWRAASAGRRLPNRALVAAGVAITVVVLQSAWLIPTLDDRVVVIIAGGEPPASHLHTVYGAVEVAKAVALGLLAAWAVPVATRSVPDGR